MLLLQLEMRTSDIGVTSLQTFTLLSMAANPSKCNTIGYTKAALRYAHTPQLVVAGTKNPAFASGAALSCSSFSYARVVNARFG